MDKDFDETTDTGDTSDTGDNVKGALKNDWEQTKNDLGAGGKDIDQDVDDTLKQAAGKEDPDRKGFTS